jgi:hypothetical protein
MNKDRDISIFLAAILLFIALKLFGVINFHSVIGIFFAVLIIIPVILRVIRLALQNYRK